MSVARRFLFLLLLLGASALFAAEESGEIKIPGSSIPKKEGSRVTEKKPDEKPKAAVKKTPLTQKNKGTAKKSFKDEKHYKIKLYIVYIILLLSLIYLLVTYRKKKRRL